MENDLRFLGLAKLEAAMCDEALARFGPALGVALVAVKVLDVWAAKIGIDVALGPGGDRSGQGAPSSSIGMAIQKE